VKRELPYIHITRVFKDSGRGVLAGMVKHFLAYNTFSSHFSCSSSSGKYSGSYSIGDISIKATLTNSTQCFVTLNTKYYPIHCRSSSPLRVFYFLSHHVQMLQDWDQRTVAPAGSKKNSLLRMKHAKYTTWQQ